MILHDMFASTGEEMFIIISFKLNTEHRAIREVDMRNITRKLETGLTSQFKTL